MCKPANMLVLLLAVAFLGCCSIKASRAEGSNDSSTDTAMVSGPYICKQPLQEYFFSFEESWEGPEQKGKDLNPFRFFTHVGTDYGRMGPGEKKISWEKSGQVCVDVRSEDWAGMWHSLAGLDREKDQYLDFLRCYPLVRDEFQPKCVGMTVRAGGQGFLKLELKSPGNEVLWDELQKVETGTEPGAFSFTWSPSDLRKVKQLNWVAEPGSMLCIDSIILNIGFPRIPLEKKMFLISYAKLARCYSPSNGIVKDRANWPAGDYDNVPTSGLFCLATCAAWKMGMVDEKSAREILHKVHTTVSKLPKVKGLLPHFVKKKAGEYRISEGSEYSTVDTSLYYHGMLLAAEMLKDTELRKGLEKEIGDIDFAGLRENKDRYVSHGYRVDGTLLDHFWGDWGGETALALLLEKMNLPKGKTQEPAMKKDTPGEVFEGRGFIAEIQSLFYPQFSTSVPDAITGANWLAGRTKLLEEQMEYFPETSPARQQGIYGLSPGEGFRGVGYAESGTKKKNMDLIHPHYILMSGPLRSNPADTYDVLRKMESRGLMPPWGMVENVTSDLDQYLPMIGSLNASFECISAYHLWAKVTGEPDYVYEAAKSSPLLSKAITAFYPPSP